MARNKYPEVTINRILNTSMALFLEKGYEQTTIQDIIDALGDLSKGAIYHHFKSKEDILNEATDRVWKEIEDSVCKLLEQTDLNGAEKLKRLVHLTLSNGSQHELVSIMPNLMNNPRLLAVQLNDSLNNLAPGLITKLLQEGQKDGSIHTDYPMELAQVLMLLCNIWLNPVVLAVTEEELNRKFQFFQQLCEFWGLDVLDEDSLALLQKYRGMCRQPGQDATP